MREFLARGDVVAGAEAETSGSAQFEQTSPAGWYANPDGTPTVRFWDGETWTDSIQLTSTLRGSISGPPAWKPDPGDPARVRYWDGHGWSGSSLRFRPALIEAAGILAGAIGLTLAVIANVRVNSQEDVNPFGFPFLFAPIGCLLASAVAVVGLLQPHWPRWRAALSLGAAVAIGISMSVTVFLSGEVGRRTGIFSLSIEPSAVDVTAGYATVRIQTEQEMTYIREPQSWNEMVNPRPVNPAPRPTVTLTPPGPGAPYRCYGNFVRTEPTRNSDVYTCTLIIPQGARPGRWRVTAQIPGHETYRAGPRLSVTSR